MNKNLLFAFPLLLASCAGNNGAADSEALVGRWREVMPVNKDIVQGVELKEDGSAASIGMSTLQYKSWSLVADDGGKAAVVLSGTSIGNGLSFDFSDTLDFISLENDTLVLGKGDMYRIQYVKENLIGGDDAAMGYTYSRVLDRKIRVFEDGFRLLPAGDSLATMAAYAVFSADSSKVELFMPEISVVLDRRTRPDGTNVWNVEDDDTFMLEPSRNGWMITRRGKILFRTAEE